MVLLRNLLTEIFSSNKPHVSLQKRWLRTPLPEMSRKDALPLIKDHSSCEVRESLLCTTFLSLSHFDTSVTGLRAFVGLEPFYHLFFYLFLLSFSIRTFHPLPGKPVLRLNSLQEPLYTLIQTLMVFARILVVAL